MTYSKEPFDGWLYRVVLLIEYNKDGVLYESNITVYTNNPSKMNTQDQLWDKFSSKIDLVGLSILHSTTKEENELTNRIIEDLNF